MTTKITLQDLIHSLRQASSRPEAHEKAQRRFFSELQEDSVLVHCGTACCIAGDMVLKAYEGVSDRTIKSLIDYFDSGFDPWDWAARKLKLTSLEATLAFHSNTHYEIHLTLADILESGLRLPDNAGSLSFSEDSTYTNLVEAYLWGCEDSLSLDEVKEWMRANAK